MRLQEHRLQDVVHGPDVPDPPGDVAAQASPVLAPERLDRHYNHRIPSHVVNPRTGAGIETFAHGMPTNFPVSLRATGAIKKITGTPTT